MTSGSAIEYPNDPPTLTIDEPNAVGDNIAEGTATYTIAFTPADTDDNAGITLYYIMNPSAANRTECTSGNTTNWTEIINTLLEDSDVNHSWNTSALAYGTYEICGKIDDGFNTAVFAKSVDNALTIDDAPTFTFLQPMGTDDSVIKGSNRPLRPLHVTAGYPNK